MNKYIKLMAATLACAGLVSCSSLNSNIPNFDELLKAQTEQNGRECIQDSDIVGYGSLDDSVVSVDSRGRGEYFLITTLYQCQSLAFTGSAAFVGGFAELCGGGRDKIFTGEESCPIKSIFKFESREAAFAAFDRAEETRKQMRQQLQESEQQNSD